MKELWKCSEKKKLIITFLVSLIYCICEYGCSFALAHFAVAPLTKEKVISLAIVLTILYLIMLISNWISSFIDCTIYPKIEMNIQKKYFNRIQNMTEKNFMNIHTGFIYNLISDVSELWVSFLSNIQNTILPLIIGIISFLIMVCKQSVIIGIFAIIISTIAIFIKYKMMKDRQEYDRESRKKYSKYVAIFMDFVQNLATVKKLNLKKFCNNKIEEKANDYNKTKKINEVKRANQNIVFHIFMRTLYIVLILSTIININEGREALPYLLFYVTLFETLYSRISSMARVLDSNVQLKTAKNQLEEYLQGSIELKKCKSWENIKLQEVVFSYTENSTKIKIPEFSLNRNDKISIMGESGQGKTTMINILAGIYPLQKGRLLIDGIEKINTKLDLVYVSQEVEMFDLSIRDNLCLGKDVPNEKIVELLDEAGMTSWYKELPDGLDTMIGERGIKLSAGQKQRLNLIRGILIDKDVYFFDEPTSNLDIFSEEKIINMIEKYLKEKTYIIVTHKPKLKGLCNKHYLFEGHMMKEVIDS